MLSPQARSSTACGALGVRDNGRRRTFGRDPRPVDPEMADGYITGSQTGKTQTGAGMYD